MRTVGQKSLLSTEVTSINTNGYGEQNDTNFALFWPTRGIVGPQGGKSRVGGFVVMVILEIKTTVFTCVLSSEGSDSFPRHLDLALASNKTNRGVKKQWNIW